MTTDTTRARPCPFCGGINIVHCGHHMYCHACGAEGPDADSQHETEAIAAWNRRAPTAQPAVDALAEAEYFIDNPSAWSNFDQRASDAIAAVCKAFRAAHAKADSGAAPAAYSGNLEQELAMLIRRIVSSARRNCEDGSNVLKLANEAWAYLVRKGLNGSPLRDAGIETDPTPPAQAADSVLEDAARESEYRRGYRHGYEQRDAEVRGALV